MITSYQVNGNSISLEWEDIGGPYTVYWGLNPATLNNKAIVNENSYTILGLSIGLKYTVLVTPIIDNSRMLNQQYFIFS
jgi:hypothetical protein